MNGNRLTTASTRTGNSAALHCQPVMRSVEPVEKGPTTSENTHEIYADLWYKADNKITTYLLEIHRWRDINITTMIS